MNWDRIEGNWKQLKGKVREKWGDDPERYREMGLEYPSN